ncbi:hypothetical protein ACQ4PT_002393 [Festuca glaucescens]
MLCGLCQRHDILRIGGFFASSLLRAISFLRVNFPQLTNDIDAGALPWVRPPTLAGSWTWPAWGPSMHENVVLSVDSGKTDETELQSAVELASAQLQSHGMSVAEYTSRACTEATPGTTSSTGHAKYKL